MSAAMIDDEEKPDEVFLVSLALGIAAVLWWTAGFWAACAEMLLYGALPRR